VNPQILHVVTSPWFMGSTSAAFEEAAPGCNTFAGVDFAVDELDVPATARVEGVTGDRAGMKRLREMIAQSRITIFHSVTAKVAAAMSSAPPSVLRVWSGWGGDYYGSTFDSSAGLLGPATRRLVNSGLRPTYWAGQILNTLRYGPLLHAAARAADVFSAPIPEDLEVFRRRFPGFRGRYSQLNYVTVEDSIATGPDRSLGRDILLGNSASPTNNHLELFELLANEGLDGRRVLAPLSYGDPRHAAMIERAGRELLGDSFVPLTGFLPLEAYHELIANCGISMFGSRRQEAIGTILRALWQGAHLVLDRRNPVVRYLRDRGVSVMLLDEVASVGLPSQPPSAALVAANRAFLDQHWSRRAVVRNIRQLIDSV
jgi:hypothetical protein